MKLHNSHSQLTSHSARKGISLVEMLAVIAIIAVLAGISYPIIVNVKASSDQATCISNLKKINTALITYDAMHGNLPDLRNVPLANVERDVFDPSHDQNCLRKQLEASDCINPESDVWICKSNKCGCSNQPTGSHYQINNTANTNPRFLFGTQWGDIQVNTGFVIPSGLSNHTHTPTVKSPKSLSEISNPQNTWIVSDIHIREPISNIPHKSSFTQPDVSPYLEREYENPPHRNGFNYLFADGSVKHMKQGEMEMGLNN